MNKEASIRKLAYVASDRVFDRTRMEGMLRDLYEVKMFSNCESVLDAFDKEIPDLVVIDHGLPRLGGLWLLKEVRQKTPGGDVPGIIFSSRDDLEEGEDRVIEKECFAVVLPESMLGSGVFFRTVALEMSL